MEYRSFGRTGIKVSQLCLGCFMFGMKTNPEDSSNIIDSAIGEGINFIDTSNVYSRGKSEEILGEVLFKGKHRKRIVLATKVHSRMDDEDPNAMGNSRRHIIEQCEANLKRLKTDYIDLYQIHRPQSDIPIDETLRAMDDLIRSGKVRYIGTSTFPAWKVMESLWVSKELGLNRFVSEQPPYNILDRRIEQELVPLAQTYGLAIIPWSPIAGGVLTGKYKRSEAAPEGSRFSNKSNPNSSLRLADKVFDVVEPLEEMAKEKGCTLSQLSLAWCGSAPGITSPIIGPRTMEHFKSYMGSLSVEITDADRERIDKLISPGEMVTPYYDMHHADFKANEYRW